ncbi:MAG: amino acid ABC transporter permease [Actinomycetota bacterium]|nr:amino acid ABC transporter permease [Actinomycetota bacterium]
MRKAPAPAVWVRKNLLSSPLNVALTVVMGAFVAWVVFRAARWVLVTAEWGVLKANLRAYMVGRFPDEEIWRIWVALFLLAALTGVSRGLLRRRRLTRTGLVGRSILGGLAVAVVLWLVESTLVLAALAGVAAVHLGAFRIGRLAGARLRTPVLIGWILAFPLVIVLLMAFGGVRAELWGGFLLNVLVAIVAIFASFPIGVLLALARRSDLRVLSGFAVGAIELIRGVPLVTLLIFGELVLPLLLPPGLALSSIVRAMTMFTIFSAAYVAEIVRGGLQGIPAGQFEAGRALGLSPTRLTALVVLPQALRSTIPAMISHFISLFKDTSLLAALAGFAELLRNARRASAGLEFIGDQAEALVPAALIFWVVAFSMARWSRRMERRLGVEER